MSAQEDPDLVRHLHAVTEAVASLQIHLLTRRASATPGGTDAYALDTILEATHTLREAFEGFVLAAVAARSGASG